MGWFKIRSWHAIRIVSRGGQRVAYCGRRAGEATEILADYPFEDKTCETCLRVWSRQ